MIIHHRWLLNKLVVQKIGQIALFVVVLLIRWYFDDTFAGLSAGDMTEATAGIMALAPPSTKALSFIGSSWITVLVELVSGNMPTILRKALDFLVGPYIGRVCSYVWKKIIDVWITKRIEQICHWLKTQWHKNKDGRAP